MGAIYKIGTVGRRSLELEQVGDGYELRVVQKGKAGVTLNLTPAQAAELRDAAINVTR